jgi:hypothetical protein
MLPLGGCTVTQPSPCSWQDYVGASFESEPVTIVAMDLGVKESSFPPKTVRKSYKPYFVWGQLINWYKQSVADPGATLNNVSGQVQPTRVCFHGCDRV